MAFQEQDAAEIPGNAEVTRWTVPVSGGTLHVLGTRGPDGASRSLAAAFQPSGISQSTSVVEVNDGAGVVFLASEVIAGVINRIDTIAAVEDTLPDAADWQAAWVGGGAGQSYILTIRNLSEYAQTILPGADVLLDPNIFLPPSGVQSFLVVWGVSGIELYPISASRVDTKAPFVLRELDATTGELPAALLAGADQIYIETVNALPGEQQLPAANEVAALMSDARVGQSWAVRIMNSGAGTLTLTADTGDTFTLVGTMTVAQDKYRDFLVQITSAWAATITSVGAGDFD